MSKIFHNPHRIKLPKSQHEVEEFAAKKGLVLCSECGAVYYKKHWHHSIEKLNLSETGRVSKGKKDISLKFVYCPACLMIKNHQYEGRIIIKNLPDKYAGQLRELVEAFCRRAYERDPMDRLIGIKKSGIKNWEITLSENELANKLTHKIKDTFNEAKSEVRFASEPSDVAEITLEFS
jgi:NMD protein affecting ribosome stability and mRNA decay